ncbi:hypothetical protein [Guptibacillus algicola]|uniref:hypothetical protein n=1 Tax=Guptibacillus algicola TaxID=225844 RepID=UPI001CD7ECA9|nr:hypothetical protein [Alkalihalobacillus algicola]MCA0986474.1 hypothetical protein [Alkalihalobacillus algicola]
MVTGILLINDEISHTTNLNRYKKKLDDFLNVTIPYTKENIIVSNFPKLILPYTPRDIRIVTEYYKGSGLLGGLHAGLSLSSFQTNIVIDFQSPFKELGIQEALVRFSETAPDMIRFDKSLLNGIYNKSIVPVLSNYLEQPSEDPFDNLNIVM